MGEGLELLQHLAHGTEVADVFHAGPDEHLAYLGVMCKDKVSRLGGGA